VSGAIGGEGTFSSTSLRSYPRQKLPATVLFAIGRQIEPRYSLIPSEKYTVRIKFTGSAAEILLCNSPLHVLASSAGSGPSLSGSFLQWRPILEALCSFGNASPFNRKAIERTISAGLTADLIDRATGRKSLFTAEALSSLRLMPST
jgi:hypothetical protein